MRLQGKTVIITGGAQGIGRSTACTLLSEGADVVLGDLDENLVKQTAEELTIQFKDPPYLSEVMGVKNDVTSLESCEQLVKTTLDRFGKVDIVVNSAGITKDNLLLRMSEAEWDLVLDVNLKGAFNLTKAVVKPMLKARKGRIINIASIVGQIGNAGQTNYSASKGGLIAFTKSCAKELASRNILVNAVSPGFIRTRMTDVLPEQTKEKLKQEIPLGRIGEPEEIAKTILFLASEDSSYITGQVLAVNGGMYL